MADIRDWTSLSTPDPEWQEVVKSFPGGKAPDIGMFKDIPSIRSWYDEAKKAAAASLGTAETPAGVVEKDQQIPMRDGHNVTVRIHSPTTKPAGGSPLFVVYHGGGWCIGNLDSETLLCRNLVTHYGAVVVNVDYRLAPEWKFPTGANDAFDATKWAAANASTLNADPSKGFILAGTSAGGSLTCIVAHLWRDEAQSPPLTGLHIIIPLVVHPNHVPQKYKKDMQAYEQNADSAILSKAACELFFDNLFPGGKDDPVAGTPLFSSLLFETGHKGLPPSYLQVCGADPLRDDGLLFERVLREEEGIPTKMDVYPGLPHSFWTAAPGMESSKKFVADQMKGVGWLLEQGGLA